MHHIQQTVEMMLITFKLHHADVSIDISDKVKFIFDDVLKLGFKKYKNSKIPKGKMLLDFLVFKERTRLCGQTQRQWEPSFH